MHRTSLKLLKNISQLRIVSPMIHILYLSFKPDDTTCQNDAINAMNKWRLPIYRVRISSWISSRISSWIFELDFRVRISSWIFELDFRVRISSWIFELGFRVGFSS